MSKKNKRKYKPKFPRFNNSKTILINTELDRDNERVYTYFCLRCKKKDWECYLDENYLCQNGCGGVRIVNDSSEE